MRVTEREHHLRTFDLGTVADSDDVELFLPALGDALHRVGHEAARQPVELAQLARLVVLVHHQLAFGERGTGAGRQRLTHLALRTFHVDDVAVHLDGDAFRHRDRFPTNSRHV